MQKRCIELHSPSFEFGPILAEPRRGVAPGILPSTSKLHFPSPSGICPIHELSKLTLETVRDASQGSAESRVFLGGHPNCVPGGTGSGCGRLG